MAAPTMQASARPNSEARTSSSASCCTTPVAALCRRAPRTAPASSSGRSAHSTVGDTATAATAAPSSSTPARTRLQEVEPQRASVGAASAPNPRAPLATPYAASGPPTRPGALGHQYEGDPDGRQDRLTAPSAPSPAGPAGSAGPTPLRPACGTPRGRCQPDPPAGPTRRRCRRPRRGRPGSERRAARRAPDRRRRRRPRW